MRRHFIFDLDGTLVDSKVGILHSVNHALSSCGLAQLDPASKDSLRVIGPPLRESFRMLSGGSGGEPLVKRLVRTYRERYETLGVFESTLYPGIEAMLRSLRGESGRTLSVVTSKPTLYATKILNHFGIAPLFGVVVGSRIDEDMSEKTGLLRRVVGARESDGGLEGYLMIGDREHDTLGARNVGIDSVGVLYGYGSEFEITSARPTFVVPSVRALRSLLARQ